MTYFEFAALRLLWTELNVDCKLVRELCKATMMLMLTMAAISAYSMAVAPDSIVHETRELRHWCYPKRDRSCFADLVHQG